MIQEIFCEKSLKITHGNEDKLLLKTLAYGSELHTDSVERRGHMQRNWGIGDTELYFCS